ncbi:L,D-transpeptidase family protein [Halomonas salipaludis]|uniref:L,D-transpeptidase family protein n=1 Tax=Halomonas salipaludis TaxID=2032625 RepID=UPI001E2BCC9A|nr:L,D-transpeptidase family protein [Halomonas salipaludis]
MTTPFISASRPLWLAPLALGIALASGSLLADEGSEWPLGHYPLPEDGNIVGERYTVEVEGDETLLDIARAHNVGYEEIRAANPEVSIWIPGDGTEVVIPAKHILPDAPREGLVVNLAELRLYYYPPSANGETPRVETYPIGIGREGFNTPLGTTETTMRLEDPAWYPPRSMREEAAERGEPAPAVVPPGPDNPLGRHAILLDIPGYLIHGTNMPDGIGMRASRGCIRMYPEDIEHLYGNIPNGTAVNIIDDHFKVGWEEDTLYVQAFAPAEQRDDALTHLLAPFDNLHQALGDDLPDIDYGQVREIMESANGELVAVYPPPAPVEEEPEVPEPGGFYRYVLDAPGGIYQELVAG